MLLRFPKRHWRASAGSSAARSDALNRSSVMSGNVSMMSGHHSRGNVLRCLATLTAPAVLPMASANGEGPPFSSMMEAAELSVIASSLPLVTSKDKRKITHGNVTVGNVIQMAAKDDGWRDLNGTHERVRWARIRWQGGSGTGTDAAKSLGMEPGTYRAYERAPESSKHTPLDHQTAARFGRKFRINWLWLLTNEGTPFDDQHSPQVSRVIEAMAQLPAEVQDTLAVMAEGLAQKKRRRTGS